MTNRSAAYRSLGLAPKVLTCAACLLAIALAPFITGFLAYHRTPDYYSWLIAHIICGEIFLVAIPLTKLSHFDFFSCPEPSSGWTMELSVAA